MASWRDVLHQAQDGLERAGVWPESAQSLLLEMANRSSADLYRDYREEMPEDVRREFLRGVEQLKTGKPLGYVLGYTWFYGRKFSVSPDVLIPRPETEELCAHVLRCVDRYFPAGEVEACDIGTGCGEIGITLSLEEPRLRMHASDISGKALGMAGKNARALGASVDFLQGDMCAPFIERGIRVDVLVSDPPYIPSGQKIDRSVQDFEPHVALFGGEDGLRFYRSIFRDAGKIIKERAVLAFEIGYDQKERLVQLAKKDFPEDRVEVLQDMEGKDRILLIFHNLEAGE